MPKPRLYSETLFMRVPEGTRARVEAVRGRATQSDWLRNAVVAAIERAERVSTPSRSGAKPVQRKDRK
jgi:hypothetical protein